MNYDPINAKKNSTINDAKIKQKNSKGQHHEKIIYETKLLENYHRKIIKL